MHVTHYLICRFTSVALLATGFGFFTPSSAAAQEPGKNKDQLAQQSKRNAEEQRPSDQEMSRQLRDGIKRLQTEGKLEAARRQAAEARASSPATQASGRINDINNQLRTNRQNQLDQERGTMGALTQVEKTRTLPKDDIEFPKDWKTRAPRRPVDEVPLTAKEKAILRALDSTVSLKFTNNHLQDVIEYIEDRTGQTVILDKAALNDIGVTYDSPVTVTMKNVTLRTALYRILRDLGLTFVVKDEAIQVVTPEQAAQMMRTQIYYVGELVTNIYQAAALIDLIESTVAPESWKRNGGTGTIVFDPARQALIIKQRSEFHPVLSSVLR